MCSKNIADFKRWIKKKSRFVASKIFLSKKNNQLLHNFIIIDNLQISMQNLNTKTYVFVMKNHFLNTTTRAFVMKNNVLDMKTHVFATKIHDFVMKLRVLVTRIHAFFTRTHVFARKEKNRIENLNLKNQLDWKSSMTWNLIQKSIQQLSSFVDLSKSRIWRKNKQCFEFFLCVSRI